MSLLPPVSPSALLAAATLAGVPDHGAPPAGRPCRRPWRMPCPLPLQMRAPMPAARPIRAVR